MNKIMSTKLGFGFVTCLGLVGLYGIMRKLAPEVYDLVIVRMTSRWYQVVLEKLQPGNRVLDVGIGTATALLKNRNLIVHKKLQFVGIDIDQGYVDKAVRALRKDEDLSHCCQVYCLSVYDPSLYEKFVDNHIEKVTYSENLENKDKKKVKSPFDAVYFSGSITLMPDPVEALMVAKRLLKPGGRIYITQTYQLRKTPFLGYIKPMMKYLTTIDFGQLTYRQDIESILATSGLDVLSFEKIPGSVDTSFQAAYLIILKV